MKKILTFTILTAFLAMGCESKKEEAVVEQPIELIDEHNARNSLDYLGTYKGTLPCADCEGIETEIVLNEDETYEIKTKYLGKDSQFFSDLGSYTWKEDGNTLEFENTDSEITYYFVSENKLIALDQEGNRITGDLAQFYELNKQ